MQRGRHRRKRRRRGRKGEGDLLRPGRSEQGTAADDDTATRPTCARPRPPGVRLVRAEHQQQGQGKGGEGEEHGRPARGEEGRRWGGARGGHFTCIKGVAADPKLEPPWPAGPTQRSARLAAPPMWRAEGAHLTWMLRQKAGSMPALRQLSYTHTPSASLQRMGRCTAGRGRDWTAHCSGRPAVSGTGRRMRRSLGAPRGMSGGGGRGGSASQQGSTVNAQHHEISNSSAAARQRAHRKMRSRGSEMPATMRDRKSPTKCRQ